VYTTHALGASDVGVRVSKSQSGVAAPLLWRSLTYYASRPLELTDRLRSEFERRREPPQARQAVPAPCLGHRVAHELLGLEDDASGCEVCGDFDGAWAAIVAEMPGSHHHDSGTDTVRALWSIVRHLRPSTVVETGVARGFSSAVVLEAMHRNDHGHLWSIDLPEVNLMRSGQAGAAVRGVAGERWTWLRGGSRRLLPRVLGAVDGVDVFVHDSLHTSRNIQFELATTWDHLRPGGVAIVDDADCNDAFSSFASSVGSPGRLWSQGSRGGAFGVLRKSD
jgi:predicted O-methyltransferase YrrM